MDKAFYVSPFIEATGRYRVVVRDLAGSLRIRGAEKEPLVVKLQPCGSIRGRVLDSDGKPLA